VNREVKRLTVPGVKQDGRLTLGEDTADNGGVHLALLALQTALTRQGKSLSDKGPDGFTNLQRFFLSYAFSWCQQFRPELIRTLVLTDTHSYPKYRLNNGGVQHARVQAGLRLS